MTSSAPPSSLRPRCPSSKALPSTTSKRLQSGPTREIKVRQRAHRAGRPGPRADSGRPPSPGFSSFRELHGTRQGSSSWFELVLLRPTRSSVPAELADAIPPAPSVADPSSHERPEALLAGYEAVAVVRLHCNVHAAHTFAECITSLPDPERVIAAEDQGEDDGTVILRQMRPGDRLAVRACAQYPMWVNAVRGCAVKVQLKVI